MKRVLKLDKNREPIVEGSKVEYQYPNSNRNVTGVIVFDPDELRYLLKLSDGKTKPFPEFSFTTYEVIFY